MPLTTIPAEPPPPVAAADGASLEDLGLTDEPDPIPSTDPPAPQTTEGPSV
ncbi:hypothetical protein [Streptomyces tauricus]